MHMLCKDLYINVGLFKYCAAVCAHQMLFRRLRLLFGCKWALCGTTSGLQGVQLSLQAGLVLLLHGVAKKIGKITQTFRSSCGR